MVRSQATTMKIRNRNGRTHAAFSIFDTLAPFGSATSRSRMDRLFRVKINPLDKYWQASFRAAKLRRGVWVPAFAGMTG
jgi:hypothetical protein